MRVSTCPGEAPSHDQPDPEGTTVTVLRALSRTLGALLLLALALPLAWKVASGDTYVTVTGHSMEPHYRVGDILAVQRPNGDEIQQIGQIVVATFGKDANDTDAIRYVHRVNSAAGDGRAWLKGDNNANRDPVPVTQSQIIGTPRVALTGTTGTIFTLLQSVPGRIGIALGGLLLLLAPGTRTTKRGQADENEHTSDQILEVSR